MQNPIRIHFLYVTGILTFIIIYLLSKNFANNQSVISYVSFALTLASILLAIIAIIHAIVSNTSMANHIVLLDNSANEIQANSKKLSNIVGSLENKVENVSNKLEETHLMVKGLTNPQNLNTSSPAIEHIDATSNDLIPLGWLDRCAPSGIIVMYACLLALDKKAQFNSEELFKIIADDNERYFLGWVMACDAANIISLDYDKEQINLWKITDMAPRLASQLHEFVKDILNETEAASDKSGNKDWYTKKFSLINDFFKPLQPNP